ncbi:MAG: HEAT repeat domain-containing protein [Acidobacteriota bacterium]
MSRSLLLVFALVPAVTLGGASAQQRARQQARGETGARPEAVSVEEATAITNGWALLAQGMVNEAAAKAAQALAAYPRSAGAIVLALEAEIARGGAGAGLSLYERWLRDRTLEEPALLRRLAGAVLREQSARRQDPLARVEALLALAGDGDGDASRELERPSEAPGASETFALASLGDERAVRRVIEEFRNGVSSGVPAIDALGSSRSRLAIGLLTGLLDDPRQEIRGAAVDALAKVGSPGSASRIAPLLSDRSVYVRARAAGALYRLGDYSGLPFLQDLMADPTPSLQLLAAEAMASRPDGTWLRFVQDLTASPDLEVRAAAGRLVAPHDPELARATFESLMQDENPAIRELGSRGLADAVTNDLTALRRLLRNTSSLVRVRAAARVLLLTR